MVQVHRVTGCVGCPWVRHDGDGSFCALKMMVLNETENAPPWCPLRRTDVLVTLIEPLREEPTRRIKRSKISAPGDG